MVFVKSPNDILDYTWDWSQWLPTGDVIDSVVWTPQSGISIANLPVPTLTSAVGSTTGGTLPAATYFYVYTVLSAAGETTKSNELSVTTTGTTSSVTLTFPDVEGAVSGRIYRGTAANGENVFYPVTPGSATTFTDTGAANTAGTPPGTNTAQNISNTTTSTTAFISGGTLGNSYTVTCQITAESGRVRQWTQTFSIINQ